MASFTGKTLNSLIQVTHECDADIDPSVFLQCRKLLPQNALFQLLFPLIVNSRESTPETHDSGVNASEVIV